MISALDNPAQLINNEKGAPLLIKIKIVLSARKIPKTSMRVGESGEEKER